MSKQNPATRMSYSKRYNRAKFLAMSRLQALHPDEFNAILEEEKAKLNLATSLRRLTSKANAMGMQLVPLASPSPGGADGSAAPAGGTEGADNGL